MTALTQASQNVWGKLFDYCQKSYQCLTYNPKLFLMRKLARIEVIRNWMSSFYKFLHPSYEMSQKTPSILDNINVDALVSGIRTDSYAPGINLPQAVIQEILDYAQSAPCYADRNSAERFHYRDKEQAETSLGRKIRLGSYFHA
jgi:hypothetical protein